MDLIADCQRVVDDAGRLIASVQADEMGRPTPCADWDVRTLVNHMIGVCARFAGVLGDAGADAGADEGDLADDDPGGAYARAAEAAMVGWRAPGALERTLQMPFGQLPAVVGVRIMIGDQLLHTWDLAKALGRPYAMDEGLAAQTLAMMQQIITDERRGPGRAFAMPVPCAEDAPVQDRVVALSGRQP